MKRAVAAALCLLSSCVVPPLVSPPTGYIHGTDGNVATVIVFGSAAPRRGDTARLAVPVTAAPTVEGHVTAIAGRQVTVLFPPNQDDVRLEASVTFGTTAPFPSLQDGLQTPEPIRHPLAARVADEETLIEAAQHGDIAALHAVLRDGINVDARVPSGAWPLALAARNGHLEVAEALLSAGADPNLISARSGATALKLAARWDHAELAEILIRHGAAVDFQGPLRDSFETEWAALHHAAAVGAEATMDVLLENGASTEVVDRFGMTPLMRAAQGGHYEAVRRLLDSGASLGHRSDDGMTPTMVAARAHHLAMLGHFIERGADIDASIPPEARTAAGYEGATALMLAAETRSSVKTVALLILAGADPNIAAADGRTALDFARTGDDDWTAELLEDAASMRNKAVETLAFELAYAAYDGQPETIQAIIGAGIDPGRLSATGQSILGIATINDNRPVLQRLLDLGADPNVRNAIGDTPLHLAAQERNLAAFEILVQAGADPTIRNAEQQTPLQMIPKDRRSDFEAAVRQGQVKLE